MNNELMYSCWNADSTPFDDRVSSALRAIQGMFSRTTHWDANPPRRSGLFDAFVAKRYENPERLSSSLSTLWQMTRQHFRERRLGDQQILVTSAAAADSLGLSIRVYFEEFALIVDSEPKYKQRLLTEHIHEMEKLLIEIGRSFSIRGCWLRKHSAFVGEPAYMYEPKRPFEKMYDPLRYLEAIDDIRAIRESIRSVLDVEILSEILEDLAIPFEPINDDKVFVRFGDPMGKGGGDSLKSLEKRISALLKKN